MNLQRFGAAASVAAALLVAGCAKKDADKAAPAATGSSSAPVVTPAAPAPAAPAPAAAAVPVPVTAPAAGSGAPVPLAQLASLQLNVPKGAPTTGSWQDGPDDADGHRLVNFVDNGDYWYAVELVDCRMPVVKDYAAKPPASRGIFAFCFEAPTGTFQSYPKFTSNDDNRILKLGNLVMIASLGVAGQAKLKGTDIEAFLGTVDLAAIAKL